MEKNREGEIIMKIADLNNIFIITFYLIVSVWILYLILLLGVHFRLVIIGAMIGILLYWMVKE